MMATEQARLAICDSESYWKRHPNGGGWIGRDCYAAESVYVSERSVIAGNPQQAMLPAGPNGRIPIVVLEKNVRVEGTSVIRAGHLTDNAILRDMTVAVGPPPTISGAPVLDHCAIAGAVEICGTAKLVDCSISSNGRISGSVEIADSDIKGDAQLCGEARIGGSVIDGAKVHDSCEVVASDVIDATVRGHAKVLRSQLLGKRVIVGGSALIESQILSGEVTVNRQPGRARKGN